MKRKNYNYLDPVFIRIPGIKTLFEKSVGKHYMSHDKFRINR